MTSRGGVETNREDISGVYISPNEEKVSVWTAFLSPKANKFRFLHKAPSWSNTTSSGNYYFIAKLPAGDIQMPFSHHTNLIKLYSLNEDTSEEGYGWTDPKYITWFKFDVNRIEFLDNSEVLICFEIQSQFPGINLSSDLPS